MTGADGRLEWVELNVGHLPDPTRPFCWFSDTPLPDRGVAAGQIVRCGPATRLPPEADFWCHEGDVEWVKVDRAVTPKPAPKPRRRRKWAGRPPNR